MKLIKLYTIISLMFVSSLSGQIVIDSDEIPHNVGDQWTKNSAHSATVDLGTTGGPQTWNFISQPMGSENSLAIIVEPSLNPYADSFPNANLVYCSPADSDTVYQYYNRNSNYLVMLGLAATSPTTPFIWKYDPSDSIPSPQSYGNSYNFRYGFRENDIAPGTYMQYYHYGTSEYNAYGTVNIPYGSYSCLRARTYDTCEMIIYVSDIPVFSDTITFINYQFVTENYGAVVCVKSDTNETDPNYTQAFILERVTSFLSGIEDNEASIDIECSIYPKLFSDYTTIQYTLPEQSHVELSLYDINGRIVKTMLDDNQNKGNYSYRWLGENYSGELLSSGIYFYQLKAGNNIYTDKVILIR